MDLSVIKKRVKFIVLIGKALHRYGASADRVEKALFLLAKKMNIKADFFCLPTSIVASFRLPDGEEFTRMNRLEPGKVNLEKLCLVDETVDRVIDEKISLDEGIMAVDEVLAKDHLYSDRYVNIGLMLISMGISTLLGGRLIEVLVAGFLGFGIGVFTTSVKTERIDTIIEMILSLLAAVTALFIAHFITPLSTQNVILSSLIYFVPGLMLTTAIFEISSQNLTAGTARLVGAIIVLLKISFGVYIANGFAQYFNFADHIDFPLKAPSFLKMVFALFMSSTGMVFVFQVRRIDIPWVFLATFTSFICTRVLFYNADDVSRAFLSGAVIGSGANLFSRLSTRPAMVFILPAILLLVPGSIGYRGIEFLFTSNTIEGVNALFATASIGIALVAGTYFGNLIIKPKRTL